MGWIHDDKENTSPNAYDIVPKLSPLDALQSRQPLRTRR